MDIYVYSDESGVFDYINNDFFVFGGIIFLSKFQKDNFSRKYLSLERCIRNRTNLNKYIEIKASNIKIKEKRKLFNITKDYIKFSVVVNQKNINRNIFNHKKSKQRFLDYAFKRGLKNVFQILLDNNVIDKNKIENIYIFCDEHTTATNGKYELKESLEQEFKYGTFNYKYDLFFEPLFENLKNLDVQFLSSNKKILIRTADIIANRVYFHCYNKDFKSIENLKNLYIKYLP